MHPSLFDYVSPQTLSKNITEKGKKKEEERLTQV